MTYSYVRAHRIRVRDALIEAHGGICILCGYSRSRRGLHFHHLDPSAKSFTIGRNNKFSAQEKMYEESKKCILVCSNCHAEIEDGLIDLSGVRSSARLEHLSDKQKVEGSTPSVPTCSDCGQKVTDRRYPRCRGCSDQNRFRVEWPTHETLRALVGTHGYRGTGNLLGCSDNAVRKRLLQN